MIYMSYRWTPDRRPHHFCIRCFVAEDLGFVEQAHLIRNGPLATGTEALALQQTNVLAQMRDLFVAFSDLGRMLLLLQKHQRPQFLDGVGELCGRCRHNAHHALIKMKLQ